MNSLTISNSILFILEFKFIGNLPYEKNMTLDFFVFTFKFLYADDTVLLAESAEELQLELNYFYEYCEKWNLKVNTKKSKVMFFSHLKQNRYKQFLILYYYTGLK
jgi:hypothetical protein